MKLFAIYIGGEHPKAHIEVHDMRFVAAETIAGTHDALRAQWWGTPGTLHLDCWARIDQADGWRVTLAKTPPTQAEKLYYVNLGGYDPAQFTEIHKNMFVVATSPAAAKARALATVADWQDAHRDDLYEAEHLIALDALDGLYVHLERSGGEETQPAFRCTYQPLK